MKINKEDRPTRYYSKRQEDAIAKSLGGSRQLNSGATKFAKGDVEVSDWIIEAKTKVVPCDSMQIRKDWFISVEKERQDMLKSYAAVAFSFGDGVNYYAMDERTFKFLLSLSRGE